MSVKIYNAFELLRNDSALKRQNIQNIDEKLFPKDHPIPKALIEISGSDGSGKTLTLLYLTALTVMPTNFGGKQGRVIYIDLKNKFNAEVFLGQIVNLIKQKAGELTGKSIAELGLNCLKAVTILRCYSLDELAFALDDLQHMLIEDENIILLAIDGIDAFYYIENSDRKKRMSTHYAQLKDRLREICYPNNLSCAYTADINYVETRSGNLKSLPDYKLILQFTNPDMGRTLNGLYIDINKNGIQFR